MRTQEARSEQREEAEKREEREREMKRKGLNTKRRKEIWNRKRK